MRGLRQLRGADREEHVVGEPDHQRAGAALDHGARDAVELVGLLRQVAVAEAIGAAGLGFEVLPGELGLEHRLEVGRNREGRRHELVDADQLARDQLAEAHGETDRHSREDAVGPGLLDDVARDLEDAERHAREPASGLSGRRVLLGDRGGRQQQRGERRGRRPLHGRWSARWVGCRDSVTGAESASWISSVERRFYQENPTEWQDSTTLRRQHCIIRVHVSGNCRCRSRSRVRPRPPAQRERDSSRCWLEWSRS